MSEQLDYLIARLAAAPTDRSLERLEAEVSRGIGRRRAASSAWAAFRPVGVASVGLALMIGLTAGGLSATSTATRDATAFSLAGDLAPSNLLEGRR
jgi:hypothetical protein